MNRHLVSLFIPLAAAALCALPGSARAASIGVDFGFTGYTVSPAALAGVPGFAQVNYNVVTAPTSNLALSDNTGAATTALLSTSGASFGAVAGTSLGPDEVLNDGMAFNDGSSGNWSFTISNIPYTSYTLLVYDLAYANNVQAITAGGITYYSTSPNPTGTGFIDGNAGTPFQYTQAVSTNSALPTANANYMLFTGLTGGSQTVGVTRISPSGLRSVGAFQVIDTTPVPEPGSAALLALGVLSLLGRRRRLAQR